MILHYKLNSYKNILFYLLEIWFQNVNVQKQFLGKGQKNTINIYIYILHLHM